MLPALPPGWTTLNLAPTGPAFAAFVVLTLAAFYLLSARLQRLVLLLASYLFCAAWNPWFLAVALGSSAANYFVALRIAGAEGRWKRAWLLIGIALNIGGLILFKYFDQTARYTSILFQALGLAEPVVAVIQPIGLSFYTLQALSYLVDVYRQELPASRSFVEISLFLVYFPKLLAGPIERAGNFIEQIRSQGDVGNEQLGEATVRITVGLVRKLVIADYLMTFIPADIFVRPGSFSAPALLFWWVVYAFVIYNDFAGYTGIARGVSELFGVRLSPNFARPILSSSFADFWNRWHISLSHWLRDYIYFPISRALLRRHPSGRYLPNLILPPLITFLVSGFWHGAVPHLVFWGLLNGVLQAGERVYKSRVRYTGSRPALWRRGSSVAATVVIMLIISVPFQLEVPESFVFWSQLAQWGPSGLSFAAMIRPLLAIALSVGLDLGTMPAQDELGWLRRRPVIQSAALAAAVLLIFLGTRHQPPAPFIYQQF